MLTIYHNPRCSKSRQTLALIEENNQEVTIVEYLKAPITADTIMQLSASLNVPLRSIMRTNEAEYSEQSLADATDNELVSAIVATPKLLERPIVTDGENTIIGRPPENVLSLINKK